MEYSNKSREGVTSATRQSGMMRRWKQEYKIDIGTLARLKKKSPSFKDKFNTLNFTGLENKLIDIHRLQIEINNLSKKHQQAVKLDDEERRYLREDMRSQHISN